MFRWAVGLLLALATLSPSAQAAIIFQDDFDSEPFTFLWVVPQNWTVTNFFGSVDTIQSGTFEITCPGGTGNCIDGDGTLFDAGTLRTLATFSLNPGSLYNLMFDFSGNQRNLLLDAMIVSVTDGVNVAFSQTFSKFGDEGFSTESHNFTVPALGNYYIVFDHSEVTTGIQNDWVGLVYDNIKLSEVPEPGTLGLLLLGLAAVGYTRRRRA